MLSMLLEELFEQKHTIKTPNTSVLMDLYGDEYPLVIVQQGTIGEYKCYTYVTDYLETIGAKLPPAVIMAIEMPFRTQLHLLGMPLKSNMIKIDPTFGDSVMEEVVLEGDYINYFKLYAEIGNQVRSRYHLDPAAMEFTVDFCQNHAWEIVDDQLIFLVHEGMDIDNSKPMTSNAVDFVEKIRAEIELPLTEQQKKLRLGYGEETRTALDCPVCSREMKFIDDTYFRCPVHHGILIRGKFLKDLVSKDIDIKITDNFKPRVEETQLVCPGCTTPMSQTRYGINKHTIDACNNCYYRWVEDGELGI